MATSLITKLPAEVSNPKLLKLGEMRFASRGTEPAKLYVERTSMSYTGKIRIVGNAHFTNSALTADYGKEIDLATTVPGQTFYISSGGFVLFIPQKYHLQSMTAYFDSTFRYLVPDADIFEYSTELLSLNVSSIDGSSVGKFIDIAKVGSSIMTSLQTEARTFNGNLNDFKSRSTIGVFMHKWHDLKGNINAFQNNVNLTSLTLENTDIEGDIESLASSKLLTTLSVATSPGIYGNANNLLDAFVSAGRNSGSLTIAAYGGTQVKLNGNSFSIVTIDFTESGWSIRS